MLFKKAESWSDIASLPIDAPLLVVGDVSGLKERVVRWIAGMRENFSPGCAPVILRFDGIDRSDEPDEITRLVPLRLHAIEALIDAEANVIAYGVGSNEDLRTFRQRYRLFKNLVVVELADEAGARWDQPEPPYALAEQMQKTSRYENEDEG